jgi:hypothetical protein
LSLTQRWSFCCPIPWWRNIWQRISVPLRPWLAGSIKWRYNGKIHDYENIRWICFGFCFGIMMYRGHIISQYKNMFDIADIFDIGSGLIPILCRTWLSTVLHLLA